jgi:hypothetical protein
MRQAIGSKSFPADHLNAYCYYGIISLAHGTNTTERMAFDLLKYCKSLTVKGLRESCNLVVKSGQLPSMSTASEVHRRVFAGCVPIRLDLPDVPFPICANVPRNLSLGHYAHLRLSQFIPSTCSSLWFSHQGEPIRWQLQLGVLHSVLSRSREALHIAAHFTDFPAGKVLRCDSIDAARAAFCHTVKESRYIATRVVGAESARAIEAALEGGNFAAFEEIAAPWTSGIAEWQQWPIKVVVREERRVVLAAIARQEGAKICDAIVHAKAECPEEVDIQGIMISATSEIEDVFPLLASADGFLYVVL